MIKHCKYYCERTNIEIAFSPFKVGYLCNIKESVSKYLKSFIGEKTRHVTTKIKEHLETDSKPHIFKHLNTNKELYDVECFVIIDPATSS